jgi:hypothetical protein
MRRLGISKTIEYQRCLVISYESQSWDNHKFHNFIELDLEYLGNVSYNKQYNLTYPNILLRYEHKYYKIAVQVTPTIYLLLRMHLIYEYLGKI